MPNLCPYGICTLEKEIANLKYNPNLLAVQEIWVQSLGWEDPLEEAIATHSSILAWRIPRTEEPGRLHTVHGVIVRHD